MPRQTKARVLSREFKEAAVKRMKAGEKVQAVATELQLWPKLLYDWWHLYERGGPEALRGPGRPRGARPRVVRDSQPRRGTPQGVPDRGIEVPGAQRVAELERKVGQQALELDFFARALRHIRASAPSSDRPGATPSSP
jgi:transposase-like protein